MLIVSQWALQIDGQSPLLNVDIANRLAGINGIATITLVTITLDLTGRVSINYTDLSYVTLLANALAINQEQTSLGAILTPEIANQFTQPIFDALIPTLLFPGLTWAKVV